MVLSLVCHIGVIQAQTALKTGTILQSGTGPCGAWQGWDLRKVVWEGCNSHVPFNLSLTKQGWDFVGRPGAQCGLAWLQVGESLQRHWQQGLGWHGRLRSPSMTHPAPGVHMPSGHRKTMLRRWVKLGRSCLENCLDGWELIWKSVWRLFLLPSNLLVINTI